MAHQKSPRRAFLKKTLLGLALFPFLRVVDGLAAVCKQEPPKLEGIKKKLLDYQGKTAKRLKFVPQAKDGQGHKKWKAGANCGNCKYYKAHKKEPKYGRCSLAANKYVPFCGWCKSYLKNRKAPPL